MASPFAWKLQKLFNEHQRESVRIDKREQPTLKIWIQIRIVPKASKILSFSLDQSKAFEVWNSESESLSRYLVDTMAD